MYTGGGAYRPSFDRLGCNTRLGHDRDYPPRQAAGLSSITDVMVAPIKLRLVFSFRNRAYRQRLASFGSVITIVCMLSPTVAVRETSPRRSARYQRTVRQISCASYAPFAMRAPISAPRRTYQPRTAVVPICSKPHAWGDLPTGASYPLMGHGTTFFNDPDPANDEHKFKEPTMNDSRNAEQIRDILRGQFDAWAGGCNRSG